MEECNKINTNISNKINIEILFNFFTIYNIRHIIISPGSRNGPIILKFTNNNFFTYSIVDERSAGFVGLGMAQNSKDLIALLCTSGSATVNYYPAITEAFYTNTPLIILTADRPKKLLNKFHGQTINQNNIFKNHTVCSIELLELTDISKFNYYIDYNINNINKCINKCIFTNLPVHINIPLSEPLYNYKDILQYKNNSIKEKIYFYKKYCRLKYKTLNEYDYFINKWQKSSKKIILIGLKYPDNEFNWILNNMSYDKSIVILHEPTSNIYGQNLFYGIDQIINTIERDCNIKKFIPDILLTIGQNVISKKIKSFFIRNKPNEHWHLDKYWHPDTFNCLSKKIKINTKFFLKLIFNKSCKQSRYFDLWNKIKIQINQKSSYFLKKLPFSDLKVHKYLIDTFPKNWKIHYSNSSPIRYASLFNHHNNVFCNRGTSGIDGCTSTAIGYAMHDKNHKNVLITGDISFFYDSNALWNDNIPKEFRIIIINNGGGNIFKFIENGPSKFKQINKYFVTEHNLNAYNLSKMYNFYYKKINNMYELKKYIKYFYIISNKPKIMEINTKNINNSLLFRKFINI